MKNQDNEERNRTFLTYCAVALAALALIFYAFTRDPSLLALTGISGAGLAIVYRYYFTGRK